MKKEMKLQQSIIDKRNAETRLINAKAVLLEMECDSKEDEITSLYASYAKLEKENAELLDKIAEWKDNLDVVKIEVKEKCEKYRELKKELLTRNGRVSELEYQLKKSKEENQMQFMTHNLMEYGSKIEIGVLKRKLRNNRLWFITIAGILSGIALFMFLTLLQWTN